MGVCVKSDPGKRELLWHLPLCMNVNSDIQIVQGIYGWHVWSVSRKENTLPVQNQLCSSLFSSIWLWFIICFYAHFASLVLRF